MRIISFLLIFLLFLNLLPLNKLVFANINFSINLQRVSKDINNFTNQENFLSINPLEKFRFETQVNNITSNSLSNIKYYFNFPKQITYDALYSSWFGYRQISGVNTQWISLANINQIGEYYLYNDNTLLENNKNYQIKSIVLSFPENWSTYENTLSNYFTAELDGNTIQSNTENTTIYVNVHPHIFDYYFEKADGSQTINQIQGNDSEPINLVLKVKDYNGCSNISGGTVSANLIQLGLGTSESLSYQSCEADGKTAIFKKTGITTNVAVGNYTFNYNDFTATDINGNNNLPNDPRFGNPNNEANKDDKKTPLLISVVPSLTPVINFVSLSENLIGSPDKQSSILTVTSTYSGSIQAKIGSDTNCNSGTIVGGITTYIENTNKTFTINASDLSEGNNTIYVCLEKDGYIGSLSRQIIKDTTSPTMTNPSYSVNVSLNNSNITFSCGEDGYFAGELRGTSTLGSGVGTLNWTSTTAGTINTYTALNSDLLTGSNLFHVFCRDNATNISFKTGSITKTMPVLSMNGLVNNFGDYDFDFEGLDGRDISITWTKPAGDISNFLQYQLYILPSNITFNSSTHGNNFITYIQNENTTNFTGGINITKDSTNTTLVSGSSYKACIAIRGDDLTYGEVGCSSPAILTADTVVHATITSAKFTSNTNLEITTDTTLDTNTGSHDFSKISYVYTGNTLNPTGVSNINGTKINFTIQDLNNLGAIGSNIIIQTGALRSSVGGYNNYHTFATITDGQTPTITGFSTGTLSHYNGFYSGALNVNFSFAESMKSGGVTKITFDGNAGAQKTFSITDPLKLVSGNHTQTLDLVSLGLVSGTTYDMKLVGQDLATNSVTSNAISVKFDNVGPTAPTLVDAPNTSSQTPTLSWNASTDDSGNGSGIKEYTLKIFNSVDCSGIPLQTLTGTALSKQTDTLLNGTYSWNVSARDNMGNIGTTSSCDSFLVDTTIPTIDNQKITDLNNSNSTNFTKSGNTIEITADLTNTDITKIKADLSSLTGNASHTGVLCSAPVSSVSCIYDGGKVTYSFMVGFAGVVSELVRQIKLIVSNISEINVVEKFASITVDNVAPIGGAITGPTGTIGGNTNTITFNTITEINLASVELGYILGGNYTFIHSGNTILSPYSWNTTSLTGGTYQIRLTAKDRSGNTLIQTGSTFTLDKSPPNISQPLFTNIISSEHIKGNASFAITWNSGSINDAGGLAENPITLEYSTNNGTNWTVISSTLPNTGTYSWNIPNISSLQAKLRIKARDNVGNESTYETTSAFVIDSQNPTFSITTGTPPNGAYINAGGFEALGTAGDNIKIDKIYYSFKRNSNNTYFDGSSYTGVIIWNLLQDNIDSISYNLNERLVPTLVNGENYDFTLKVLDKSGNEFTTIPRQYIADTINPILNITNSNNSYFSGSINISGTVSDVGAGISSVKISIKKGNEFWNGSTWVGTGSGEILSTNTTNNYADWNYNFNAPGLDNDGQNYEVIVYAYDKSYKVNNTSSGTINIILDKTGPVIESDVFTYTSTGFYGGGDNFNLTWNPAKITSSGAGIAHIKLEYNHAGNIVLIGNNLPNNGSYSFTLPEINGNIRPLITAYDTIGNASNIASGSLIQVDSTPPTITSIETKGDTSGNISGVIVRLSEEIKNPSILDIGAIFSSSTGSFSGSYIHTIQDNKTVLELKFNTPVSGTHTAPTISWNENIIEDLAGKKLASGNMLSIDKAQPVVLSAEIFDINNNGKLDKIEVVFSENLSSTTDALAWNLNNAFEGLSINSVSVSNNKVNIILNEGTQFKTDIGNMSLNFVSNSNYKDNSSNNNQAHSQSNIALIDKAKPVLISSELKATNYIADKIELTFSETLTGTMTGFSISSGSILSTSLVGGNKIELGVDSIAGTNPSITVDYTPGDLADSATNALVSISNRSVVEKISPKLQQTATTLDQNGNGKIDGILLEFSEKLNGNLSDLVVNVNGYVTSGYSMSGSQSVIVSVGEKQLIDTSSTPSVTLSSNNALTDTAGNKVLSNQTLTSQDGVGPVIIGARFDEGTLDLHLTFSESVSGSLNNSSFVLQNAGSSIVSTGFVNGATTATITLSNDTITYGTSEISFASNAVGDNLGNKQNSTHFTKISASVLINEYLSEGSVSYIELKNISSSSVNIGGWVIENALSGTGLIIDTYSLPAGEYYLIATNNTSFSGITVNQIASLDINSNLVLKNGGIIVDNALYQIGSENISFERFANCSDGLNSNCWYQAVASNGFNNINYKGTPSMANIFDFTPPNLTTNLTGNLLLPIGYYNLVYTYSDDILINTGSISFDLKKWNGSSFVNTSGYATGTIDYNNANFSLSGLEYGRYKTVFSISDIAGNISSDIKEFYVDNFSFTISTGSLNLGILEPNNLKLANTLVNVEVKTIGAGFEISHHYDENKLGDWDGNKGFGACVGNSCTVLENYKNNIFVNQAGELQSSGELKTYNYKVKYGSLVDGVKPAGMYQIENEYRIGVNY